jgi:hypothetical protein
VERLRSGFDCLRRVIRDTGPVGVEHQTGRQRRIVIVAEGDVDSVPVSVVTST